MLIGTLSATLTTNKKDEPCIHISVKSDVDGYVYSSTYGLSSEASRNLTKMVLEYLGYNPKQDPQYTKLISGDCVDTSKTIEFVVTETVGQDGKTYKNVSFPNLMNFNGKPKNMLTKDSAKVLIATHNLSHFFNSFKEQDLTSDDIGF